MARFVVGGLLVHSDSVLLATRSSSREVHPGVWDVPGGHSENGETPEATLIRELTEELGVVPLDYREIAVLPETAGHLPFHLYSVTRWRGTPRNLQREEHTEIAWVPLDDVAALDLALPPIRRSSPRSAREAGCALPERRVDSVEGRRDDADVPR